MLAAMAVDGSARGAGPILRFQVEPPPGPMDGIRVVVLDTSWTPGADDRADGPIGLRDVAAQVLAGRDLLAESASHLDSWATASGVVATMTIGGTSFWYQGRVRLGLWLHERLLWLALIDDLARTVEPSAIECGLGCDDDFVSVARSIAARDGLPFRVDDHGVAGSVPDATMAASPPAAPTAGGGGVGLLQRLRRRLGGPTPGSDRRRLVAERLDALAADPGRLLVVMAHARQRVETASGPRLMNAYLGPVVDRLRGTALEPVEIELRTRLSDPGELERFEATDSERAFPGDIVWTAPSDDDPAELSQRATEVAERITGHAAPMVVAGVDLGPAVGRRVAEQVRKTFAHSILSVGRIRWILGRLRPVIILIADEYHRQDWIAAARAEGIRIAAIQHGMISRSHNGYIHPDRPPELTLVDRTYVFGEWERRLLIDHSVYRPEEVVVGGSPRLDLADPRASATDRDAVRAELGIAPGDRLVVLSGTWGPVYRQFHYPIALASLFDRPLPRVHLVIKLHPAETDEGPYRAVIDGVAAARGFEPPPMTVVQAIDLYRLLGAADAHIGVQSTVLTEAVVTGTLNLLAATTRAPDPLGYVEAGVAIPVRTGEDLVAALDAGPAAAASPEVRRAFIDAHFEPGSARERIAEDLLAWPDWRATSTAARPSDV